MNRAIIFTLNFFLIVTLFPQQKQNILIEKSLVVNIEVPVRVFDGGDFVNSLTLNDFEVLEDGIPQKVEAVYLVKKDEVQRKEEKKPFAPQTERTFYLFFEVSDWDPRIGDAVDYFTQNVLLEGDNLIAISPIKTYRLKDKGLEIKTREEIAEELKSIIRKDAIKGDAEYRSAVEELEGVVRAISSYAFQVGDAEQARAQFDQKAALFTEFGLDELLMFYEVALQKLETLREVDQLSLLDFAAHIKEREGQKYVFLLYQREFLPQLEPLIYQRLMSKYQDNVSTLLMLSGGFGNYHRDVTVDIEKVKRVYADASTSIHFMFLTRPRDHTPGIRYEEHSEDIYAPFVEMAKASGGFVESSANPDFLFKKAVEASENYYLLYYAPKEYAGDGTFKEIKVRVKGKGYKIVHRLGYFSN